LKAGDLALGRTETVLDARSPMVLDDISTVDVRLAYAPHILLNADWDALMVERTWRCSEMS
jgi:hypothetical protein